jgi:glyoxylase-like metal-dependent hydrolase (beta-lactamase superfamily II)
LIDTGMPHNTKRISDYISNKLGRQLSDIKMIVLTHYHIDHVGCASELRKLADAKIAVHQEDADFVAGRKPMPAPKGLVGILLKASSPLLRFTPVQPEITLKEGDKVESLVTIHTPGHTPGSISLYDPDRKVLFTGDTLRFKNSKVEGPPKKFTFDMDRARQSIEKISQLDFDVMLSGHGEPLKPHASNRVKDFYSSHQP